MTDKEQENLREKLTQLTWKRSRPPQSQLFFSLFQLKQHFRKVYRRRGKRKKDVVELRLRRGRHFSSPCPSVVHLTECFRAHSLATGVALNCFYFQTLKTECSDLASPANSLTVNMGSGGHGKKTCLPSLGGWIKLMNGTALKNWQSYLGFVKGLTDLFGRKWWKRRVSMFPFQTRRAS